MPPFKDEHILILAPGSQTTLAQLGLPESFTPARFRFPTRMFPAETKGEWEPYKVREKVVTVKTTKPTTDTNRAGSEAPAANDGAETKEDAEMKDAGDSAPEETASKSENIQEGPLEVEEEQVVYEEDPTADEGAVYPLSNGSVVDWPCFFALLTHIYNTLSPPFHTPIMLISQPAWTARDREVMTQFVFEKFKTPAFCMMDSALAVCYAYGTANATVVDVGYGKADVTAVTDFVVNDHGRGLAVPGCGGEAMTTRLLELLRSKAFTRDMCEQLKKSNICEILPAGVPLPGGLISASELPNAASESASTAAHRVQEFSKSQNAAPGRGPEISKNMGNGEDDDEGVIDVAAIVSGNTSEYLARREKEKAEKTATKKNNGGEAAGGKPVRLPNSKKEKASFQFQEFVKVEPENESTTGPRHFVQQKRDIEVGIERFLCTTSSEEKPKEEGSYGILDTLAAQIHHTILAVPDAPKRSELWDSLIILGNGSKIKGFPQALLHTISQKYVLSPSSGTIFTSELPSAFSTPLPTGGTNTPNPQNPGSSYNPAAHGVNPLLVAATHSNNPATPNHLNPNLGITDPTSIHHHHRSTGHSQTPTSVKQLKPPEYFPEWKSQAGGTANANASVGGTSGANGQGGPGASNSVAQNGPGTGSSAGSLNVGMEEATFLGAQVAAKVVFVIDQGLSKGFLSRVDYNEVGPTAIHDCTL